MTRPQFSLKMLLFWMTPLAASVGSAAHGIRLRRPVLAVHLWMTVAGVLLGICIGVTIRRPLLGAVVGALLWPAYVLVILVLLALNILDAN